jgi:hypothetical protein
MPADDPTLSEHAPDASSARPRPHVGRLLALADEHRRGLHAGHPDSDCSRCLIAALEATADLKAPQDDGA